MTAGGVVVPEVDGARSTSALGRTVVSDALRPVEAGLDSREAALSIAEAGLASLYRQMRYDTGDGEIPVGEACGKVEGEPLGTQTVTGAGEPQRDLVLPYRGKRLR